MRPVVVIPVYKPEPSGAEALALRRCVDVLSAHRIVLVAPEDLPLGAYRREAGRELPSERFAADFFAGIAGYNRLMTDPAFYRRFAAFDYMLVFQLDAWVFTDELMSWCARGYDYVGAPWFEKFLSHEEGAGLWKCGNGGFSLRRIGRFLAATESGLPRKLMDERKLWEDGCFAYGLDGTEWEMAKPDPLEAAGFSVEHSPAYLCERRGGRLPFGCHAWEHCQFFSFWRRFIPFAPERPRGGDVSLITEVGDDLAALQVTADSLLTQSFRNFEWILCDRGATPAVRAYVEQVLAPYVVSGGLIDGDGLSAANGRYVQLTAAGDAFCNHTALAAIFGSERTADVVHCEWVEPPRPDVYYDHSVRKSRPSVFFRTSLLRLTGLDRRLGRLAYWGAWRTLERIGATFEHVETWACSVRGERPPDPRERARREKAVRQIESPGLFARLRFKWLRMRAFG